MTQAPAAAARQAALILHAMTLDDQEWVLGSVPSRDAATLRALLEELRTLGIPPEPDSLREALLTLASAPVQGDKRLVLDAPAPAALHGLLQNEAPQFTACVLASGDASWRAAVVAGLPAATRAQVEAADAMASAPALDLAIREALSEALALAPCLPAANRHLPRSRGFRADRVVAWCAASVDALRTGMAAARLRRRS
jgi:hypothetical protein